jgi:hypothetical protein
MCIIHFSLRRKKFGTSYIRRVRAQGTSKDKTMKKRHAKVSQPVDESPHRAAIDTNPALAQRRASSNMAPARATGCKLRPPARGRDGSSVPIETMRPTRTGYQNLYGRAWWPPSARATTRPRQAPPSRESNPPCRRTVAHKTKFLDCEHNQGEGDTNSPPPVHKERRCLCHTTHDVKAYWC